MPPPDRPTHVDKLGFTKFTEPLAARIAKADRGGTPWTIGVYGEWGSGKTSFLMMVSEALRKRGVRPIWFEAWRYTREENLWAALIEKIITESKLSVPWYRRPWARFRVWWCSIDFRAGLWEVFRKTFVLLFRVALLALLILMALSLVPVESNPIASSLAAAPFFDSPVVRVLVGLFAGLGAKPDALLKLFDIKLGADLSKFRRSRAHREQSALLDDFNREFKSVLDVVYTEKPLVVVIDDLDRCLPEQTLQIIETVKLVLDEPGCVFLLAADREIIEHAIAVKYKDLPVGIRELGETYFEKVVQLPYPLPPAAAANVDEFIRSLSTDEDVLACVEILRGGAPYNPRRIKRNVQAFALLKEFAEQFVPPVLAKVVVIQSHYRQLYRAAIDDHTLLARLESAYRTPASLENSADLVLVEQAKRFDEMYPQLKMLMCVKVSEQDTFKGIDVQAYLSFVKSVTAIDPPPPPHSTRKIATAHVSSVREDVRWREYLTSQLMGLGIEPALDGDLVAVLSPRSAGSEELQRSWAAAIAEGRQIFPIMVEECVVPRVFAKHPVTRLCDMDGWEAEHTLAELFGASSISSREDVEFPGGGYVVNNLPLAPRREVPRTGLPERIDSCFARPTKGRPTISVLVGLGGTGKTAAARQYATARLRNYDIIWWIRADHVAADLEALARQLSESPQQVLQHLARRRRWLLVYDGAGDPETFKEQLPSLGGGHVLVTSRDREWARYGELVEVGPMTERESLEVLGSGDEAAAEYAAAVEHLPAALSLAGGYLREPLAIHRHLHDLLLDDVVRNPDLRTLLIVLSMLAPSCPADRALVAQVLGVDVLALDRSVRSLNRMSLLAATGREIGLVPIVGKVVRTEVREKFSQQLVARTLAAFTARVHEVTGTALADFTANALSVTELAPGHAEACADLLAAVATQWFRAGDLARVRELTAAARTHAPNHALAARLDQDASDNQPQAAVIMTLGAAGHGKTTLARELRQPLLRRNLKHVDRGDHAEHLLHLVAGTPRPDCVLLVVAADAGWTEAAGHQLDLAVRLGVRAVVLAITKWDLGDGEQVVSEVVAVLSRHGLHDVPVVRLGAGGDDVPTLADVLARTVPRAEQRLFLARDVDSFDWRGTVVRTRVERGRIAVGDAVALVGRSLGTPAEAAVVRIESGGQQLTSAAAGYLVDLTLDVAPGGLFEGVVLAAPGTLTAHVEFEALTLAQPPPDAPVEMRGTEVGAKIVLLRPEHALESVAVTVTLVRPVALEVGDTFSAEGIAGVVTRIVK